MTSRQMKRHETNESLYTVHSSPVQQAQPTSAKPSQHIISNQTNDRTFLLIN